MTSSGMPSVRTGCSVGTRLVGPNGEPLGPSDEDKVRALEEAVAGLENVRVQLLRTIAVLVHREGGEVEVTDADLMTAEAAQLGIGKHPIKAATTIKVIWPEVPSDSP